MFSLLLLLFPLLPGFVDAKQKPSVFCDITDVDFKIPFPSGQSKGMKPKYAGIGKGWSNYQCTPSGTYKYTGIDLEIIDISCTIEAVHSSLSKRSYYYQNSSDVWVYEAALGHVLGPNPQKIANHYTPAGSESTTVSILAFGEDGAYPGDTEAVLTLEVDVSVTTATTNLDDAWRKYKVDKGPAGLGSEVWMQGLTYQQPPLKCIPGSPPITLRSVTTYIIVSDSATSYKSSPAASANPSGKPKTLNASGGSGALADNEIGGNNSSLQKLLNYAPIVLGLLGALIGLCVILVGMGIAGLVKKRKSVTPSRTLSATYHPVQLDHPKPTMLDSSYKDDPERYDA